LKKYLKTMMLVIVTTALFFVMVIPAYSAPKNPKKVRIVVRVSDEITDDVLTELSNYGKVITVIKKLNAVGMKVPVENIDTIRGLEFVTSAGKDVERYAYGDYSEGLNTWNLDIINVTEFNPGFFPGERVVDETGEGVYVAVLDTGLVKHWRDYFPEDRIATEYGMAFGGGGNEKGNVTNVPKNWERDTHSHGTHVSSTIIGYSQYGTPINGVAPKAKIIPVKVLGNSGFGWSVEVAEGIQYIADLKTDELLDSPVVINMSIGGPELSDVERTAIDNAIEAGVIVVVSAGNEGEAGMGYPGAYEPVISVAAAGWIGEWSVPGWWNRLDVPEDLEEEVYITTWSSRELPGQDLDVAAPGSWVVGPYMPYGVAHPPIWAPSNVGQYYYVGGTSMACPHVAGTAALMLEKNSALVQNEVEDILINTALDITWQEAEIWTPGCRYDPSPCYTITWKDDAEGAGLIQADDAITATPTP